MSMIKILRLSTGEDVIAKVTENTDSMVKISKSFVIIPRQAAPGQPVQLMMTPYLPFVDDEELSISKDKIVTIATPKKDILDSYSKNTSSILQPDKELITETTLPKLK